MAFYAYVLLLTICHAVLGADYELTIQPGDNRAFVMDKNPFKLICSFKPTENATDDSVSVSWTRSNGEVHKKSSNKGTLQIDSFSFTNDADVYICTLKNEDDTVLMSRNITLIGIREDKRDAELKKNAKGQKIVTDDLSCNITVSDTSLKVTHPDWFQNQTSIEKLNENENAKRFTLTGKQLHIDPPMTSDLGLYYARYNISDGEKTYSHWCEVPLWALPTIDYMHREDDCKTINVIEGKKVDIKCSVWGYPQPVISWTKDGKPLNVTQGSTKILMKPVDGYKNAHLRIDDADFDDSGHYTCKAYSKFLNASDSEIFCVGVKDKHAALWPFLAIVCEVLVLCAIIFVYEKKRNDKAKAAEREAQDVPETEIKTKVRNRRQQSS